MRKRVKPPARPSAVRTYGWVHVLLWLPSERRAFSPEVKRLVQYVNRSLGRPSIPHHIELKTRRKQQVCRTRRSRSTRTQSSERSPSPCLVIEEPSAYNSKTILSNLYTEAACETSGTARSSHARLADRGLTVKMESLGVGVSR